MVYTRPNKPLTSSPVKRRPARAQRPAVRSQKPPSHVRATAPPAVRALRIARVEPTLARQPPSKLASAIGLRPMRARRDESPQQPRSKSPSRKVLPPVGRSRQTSNLLRKTSNAARMHMRQSARSHDARGSLPPLTKGSKRAVMTPPVASSASAPLLPRVTRPHRKPPKVQVATTKAAGMRAAIVRRQAAETSLRNAAACRDADQLMSSIAAARATGVANALILEAEHVLAASQRAAAEVALRKAMDCDWPELENLESCIDAAKRHGVSKVIIYESEDMLPSLRESAKQRRAAETTVAMCNAMSSRDPDELAKCIIAARAAEVAETKVHHADAFLLQLREELAHEKAETRRKLAVSDLQDAINARSLSRLPACIQKARDAQIEMGLLQDAELLLSTLRFESALRDAIRSKSVEHLQSFIARAQQEGLQLGIARNLVKEAELVLQECREEIKRRESAEAVRRDHAETVMQQESAKIAQTAKAGVERSTWQSREQVLLELIEATDDGRLARMLREGWKCSGKPMAPDVQVSCEDLDIVTFGLTELAANPTSVAPAPSTVTAEVETLGDNEKPLAPELDDTSNARVVVEMAIPNSEGEGLLTTTTENIKQQSNKLLDLSLESEIEALRVENSALKLRLELQSAKVEEMLPRSAPASLEKSPKKAPRITQSDVVNASAMKDKVDTLVVDEETAFRRNTRREFARSYVQGSLMSTLKVAFTIKPEFELARQMTRDMMDQALETGKFHEAMQLAFDTGA